MMKHEYDPEHGKDTPVKVGDAEGISSATPQPTTPQPQ